MKTKEEILEFCASWFKKNALKLENNLDKYMFIQFLLTRDIEKSKLFYHMYNYLNENNDWYEFYWVLRTNGNTIGGDYKTKLNELRLEDFFIVYRNFEQVELDITNIF